MVAVARWVRIRHSATSYAAGRRGYQPIPRIHLNTVVRDSMSRFTIVLMSLLSFMVGCLPMSCNASTAWQELAPGIAYHKISLTKPIISSAVHAFKIDLSRYQLRIAQAKTFNRLTMSTAQFAQQSKAVLAVNGGFFTPFNVPLGLRIDNGKVLNPLRKISWWGVFYINKSKPHISSLKRFRMHKKIQFAIQAGPRLLVNGHIPKLKPGQDNRTALCINRAGKVILIVTEHWPTTTTEFAKLIRKPLNKNGLGCYQALNLDGGSSSQIYANINAFNLEIAHLSLVTDAVVVTTK